ncbi:MAG: coat protein [Plant associated deltapartitivirus 4]|nr:MAG: coat protein [Plant associated deltapartitivirus 4]
MADKRPRSDDAQGDTTHPDPSNYAKTPAITAKKPAVRSAEASVNLYLQTQNRIGEFNHYPLRKHRYINLYVIRILDSLVGLYVHFFKMNWEKFARAAEKTPLPTGVPDHFHLCAYTYLSHWMIDLYYHIRKSCKTLNPLAFTERYFYEVAPNATSYDNYLAHLINAIRPTPINGAIADEMYIPVLGKDLDFSKNVRKGPFSWNHWQINHTLFQMIHQTLEIKKIVKMTLISEDPTGRASWLFDWFDTTSAYAWFPLENNYNETDISVAYILGVACTPKVSLPDIDDWRYLDARVDMRRIDVDTYKRVIARRKFGNSEHRILVSEEVTLPNYYETDATKFNKLNVGPLKIIKSSTDAAAEETTSETVDEDYVPESPRPGTRSQTTDVAKSMRVRVYDYLYHTQVINRADISTRYTAFKMFNPPPQ